MNVGKIERYFPDRGFGFVRVENESDSEAGNHYFFHVTALAVPFEPHEGMRVQFDVGIDPKSQRQRAQNLRRI